MRIKPLLLVAPIVMAGTMLLVAPSAARAAGGMTETGTTTYEVIPDKNLIAVTVTLSDYNSKPDTIYNGVDTYYFWDSTELTVENEASAVSVSSNVGTVSQATNSTDNDYRYIKLSYSPVYYGQTRVLTAKYTIPAAPHAVGGFRAGKAYASLCAVGNGYDTGTLAIVIPTGFNLYVDYGGDLPNTTTSGGKQVFSSGTQASPYKFWTCVDAEDEANLTHTPLTTAGQSFDIQGWPEDASWNTAIRDDVTADVQELEDLTGLTMPGGTVKILEAGDQQLGEYGGLYNSLTTTATIPETVHKDVVAHELSHIWFNRNMLTDKWMSEGLAGYSQKVAGAGNYTPCADPGAYPGTGAPNLMSWQLLTNNATTQQVDISDWQYAASCYVFTTLADAMGPANYRNVMKAAAADEMPYQGGTPGEKLAADKMPISSKRMLDLLDEFGMVPGKVSGLDKAQTLLSHYGLFDATDLAARSSARSTYHLLSISAGAWNLPLAIRAPMTTWDFVAAQTSMATAQQILATRDSIETQLSGFTLDGTEIQKDFESAATQTDLDSLLTIIKKEADAAAKLDQATKLHDGGRSILESIGLLGADVTTPLKQARTDLTNVKPDTASAEAQAVIDKIDGSSDQGLLRGGAVLGAIALLMLLIALIVFIRRRRHAAVMVAPGGGMAGPYLMPPFGPGNPGAYGPPWQTPPPSPGPGWQTPGNPNGGTAPGWGPPLAWQPAGGPPAGTAPVPPVPPAPWQGQLPPVPPAPLAESPTTNPDAMTDPGQEPPTV